MGTELLPYWSFCAGFSTVAQSVENLCGLRRRMGESGSGVGKSCAGCFGGALGSMVGILRMSGQDSRCTAVVVEKQMGGRIIFFAGDCDIGLKCGLHEASAFALDCQTILCPQENAKSVRRVLQIIIRVLTSADAREVNNTNPGLAPEVVAKRTRRHLDELEVRSELKMRTGPTSGYRGPITLNRIF